MGEVVELRDGRAERARRAILKCVAEGRKMTVKQVEDGRNFYTDDGMMSRLKITISMREAFSLVRVLGPIGLQNGDGSFTRLFAAMHICQKALLRAPQGKSLAVIAALQVLQVAINDQLWACRDVVDEPRRLPPSKQKRAADRAARRDARRTGRIRPFEVDPDRR